VVLLSNYGAVDGVNFSGLGGLGMDSPEADEYAYG
jgi:hypothetical protein